MKALRIAALGFALVVGSATVASAQQQQGAPGRGARPDMRLAGIDSALTADQKAKIAEINTKYQPEMQAIRDLMATDREGAMKKRQDLNAKINPEIRAVLTKEQQAIFDKNLDEIAKRAAAPRPAPTI